MITEKHQDALAFQPPDLLINKFCKEHDVPTGEAKQRFEETKKFLVLCATNQNFRYSPSKEVDEMWHQFILHTRDYFEFCNHLGSFIHHQPSEKHLPEAYAQTRHDLGFFFGELNEKYWGTKSADCDDCSCCP